MLSDDSLDAVDEDVPTARQNELIEQLNENIAAGKLQCQGVTIRTTAEVAWLRSVLPSGTKSGDTKNGEITFPTYDMRGANFREAVLTGANFEGVDLEGAVFGQPRRQVATEFVAIQRHPNVAANLKWAFLTGAKLSNANLRDVDLNGADLQEANLSGTDLTGANLWGAVLRQVRMDNRTILDNVALNTQTCPADVDWNGTHLERVNWKQLPYLGDEYCARHGGYDGFERERYFLISLPELSDEETSLDEEYTYAAAVRGSRQLATALRSQGLNEDADRFAYRAQVLQREVLRRQGQWLRWVGSVLLWLVAGYGYRPLRSFIAYILVVGGFALAYYFLGPTVGIHFEPLGAAVFSVTSFHGRGFSPGENAGLTNPVTVIAAAEAVIGLLIEITFIATFTQRFFSK